MNAKRWRKYKAAVTVKKSQNSGKHGRSNILRNSRTYHRIRGNHQINIIGGGGTKEEKDAKKAAKQAAKDAEKTAKEAEKKRQDDEKKKKAEDARILKEEKEKEKQRKKDAKKEAKIKAKQPPAKNTTIEPVKDVANEDTNEAAKPPGNANTVETTNANISNAEQPEGAIQIVPGNTDANTTNTNTNETSTDELAKPEPEKTDGWVKKTLKNTGAAIKNIAWGDENTGKLRKAAKLMMSPITLPGTAIGNTFKYAYKGSKYAKTKTGLFINKLGIPESLKFVKKYKTWRTTSKATTGELKKQKYEQQTLDKNKEIENYASRIMELNAIGKDKLTPEQKKELKTVESKLKSAESDLDYISIKNAEWQTKSAKSQSNLQKLQATRILPRTKKDIDRNIQLQQKALNSNIATKEALKKKEIDNKEKTMNTEFETRMTAELNNQLQGNPAEKQTKIRTEFEKYKTKQKQELEEQKTKMRAAAYTELKDDNQKLQLQVYSSQIKEVAVKLGVNIKADNPQLMALIAEHHSKPDAKPLTGEELIKKVSEVGFTNIVSNKQTIQQATKYLSAPHAVFKPGEEKAAIEALGSSTKQSFYKTYVRDAEAKLSSKLNNLATSANNASTKVKLSKLKGQVETMNMDKRFQGARKDEYLYNLYKQNEAILGISTTQKVAEVNKVKDAISTNTEQLKTATDAYYTARTQKLTDAGKQQLAAIYNPTLKKYLSGTARFASVNIQNLIDDGLKNYKYHISKLLQENPLALKAEDPETYDKIIAAQQSRPSTAQIGSTAAKAPKNLEESEA